MKISLAVICKADDREAKRLNNLLASVDGIFDEICITITGKNEAVKNVANKYKAKISHFDWVDNFAAARNFNFGQCTGDWIVWYDADDIVRGAGNIRNNIQLADDNKVTGLSTLYHYSHDKEGKVKDSHWKLQMVKRGHYQWKGIIHEDLLPTKEGREARINDVIRVHTANEKDSDASLLRNKAILEEAIKEEPHEPRHYFYAARCYLGTEEWDKVIDVITTYLTLSNWPEERYDAINMMGEAYMRIGDNDKAIETHQRAILELEDAPDAYIYKARNYIQQEEWVKALTNLEIAHTRDKDAVNLKKSALYDHDLYLMACVCYMNLGKYQEAHTAAQTALKSRKSERAEELSELTTTLLKNEEMTKMFRKLGEELLEDQIKLQHLVKAFPDDIKDDPRLLQLTFAAVPPTHWEEGSIVWFCGNSIESWDGNSTKKGGIGGSETAVIELAKRQAKAGRKVVVYNRCDAPAGGKEIDGVLYKNFWEFDQRDTFDTIILWRSPQYVDHVENANTVIVDMHDVSNKDFFTPERLEKIDKVMVKTECHKALYPNVPDEKLVVAGNGIDLSRFKSKAKKDPNRFIYTSAPNRGLENILDAWPQIRERVPEAELHVFYGWHTFVESHKNDPAIMQWVEAMKEKMQQEGIVNHGRVDQKTLAEEMQKSTLWLYPTEFFEIHCITALEMQAAKVYPITTGFAALAETQQSGVKIEGDPKTPEWQEKFINEIQVAVENPSILKKELEVGEAYAKECSWDNVVTSWL